MSLKEKDVHPPDEKERSNNIHSHRHHEQQQQQQLAAETIKPRRRKRRWDDRLPSPTVSQQQEQKQKSSLDIPGQLVIDDEDRKKVDTISVLHEDDLSVKRFPGQLVIGDEDRNKEDNISVLHEDDLSVKRLREFRRGRSTSTCRFNEPSFSRKNGEDWRCLVCYLWNGDSRHRCERCGAKEGEDRIGESLRANRPSHRSEHHHHRYHHNHHRSSRDYPRWRERGGEGEERRRRRSEWPPLFNSNESQYVFDERSAMFYNFSSDFFYDAKTHLYYGNKQKAYFRYNRERSPPFEVVKNSNPVSSRVLESSVYQPMGNDGDPVKPLDNMASHNVLDDREKASRQSNSNTMSPSRSSQSDSQEATILDKRKKENLKNITRWSSHGSSSAEGKMPIAINDPTLSAAAATTTTAITTTTTATEPQSQRSVDQQQTANSKAGQSKEGSALKTPDIPICILCMRKFQNMEKLKTHEELSELHKANLKAAAENQSNVASKAAASSQKKKEEDERYPKTKYIDRASKRRHLYCELPAVSLPTRSATMEGERLYQTPKADPSSLIGADSVGNVMFQKMMAKAGPKNIVSSAMTDNIRKEWAQIESISYGQALEQKAGSGLGNKPSPWSGRKS